MGALGHIDILGAHVSTGVEWKGISDHRPITAQYRVARPSTKAPVLATAPPKRPELDRSDPRVTADFDELLRKYIENHPCTASTPEEANDYLFRLERASVRIVRRINQHYGKDKKRSPRKDGWSPQYAAMKIHLQTLLHIRRHTLGHHKYHQWRSPEEACTGIAQLADLWIARTDTLSIPGTSIDAIRYITGLGPNYWKHIVRPPTGPELDTEISLLQSRMHGRLRSEMRSSINYHCAKRETLRELGKTKQVLKSILGRMGGRKHQDPLFLGAVRESDTLVDVTPMDVHSALTNHFRLWYATPPIYADDRLHNGDWREVLDSFPSFYSAVAHTGVPENLCHLIYCAILQNPGRTEAHEHLLAAFATVPTFEEFTSQVRSLRNNSAPGMSGCSYNMIKSWP
jgi:hypothetical protein